MKIKAEPSVAVGLYMVMVTVTVGVAGIRTFPLKSSIRQGTFSRKNWQIIEELKRRLRNEIYGFPQVDENPTVSDAEWFGWTAAY
jgi:hypothetical protein